MDRHKYGRYCETLRVTELGLRAPAPDADLDTWRQVDGHVRVAAALHRTLGDFSGALNLLRWFRDRATIAGITRPEVNTFAAAAATTVWGWEAESAARHDKLIGLRMELAAAETRGGRHDVRALRMQLADHHEASGDFGEAATQLQAVMLQLGPDEPSLPHLRARSADLEARGELHRDLATPPDRRPVLADDLYLEPPALELSPVIR